MIEGEGNLCIDGAVNITETLKLKPLGSPPSDPEKGTMYFDNIDNKLKVFDGTSWQNLLLILNNRVNLYLLPFIPNSNL